MRASRAGATRRPFNPARAGEIRTVGGQPILDDPLGERLALHRPGVLQTTR
jgi:hypothetical protein